MIYLYLPQWTCETACSANRRAQLLTAIVVLLALAALAVAAVPHAAAAISDEEELTRFGGVGSGAGQLKLPNGLATDPVTGHVYALEESNNRVSEFTPWGNFVKAFGWDVAPGAVNEQQEVRVRAAAGQFKLEFEGEETTDLAFDAPGSESEGAGSVEAALNALPSIGGTGTSVNAVPGTPDGKTPYIYVVAFKGSLAGTNVTQLTIANGTTAPGGGVPSTTLEARTRADGTPDGTGLESCTAESGCKAGLAGAGVGQVSGFGADIAVDAKGNVYLDEVRENHRVQKFDPDGRFLLMFGGEVNETTGENICTKAQLDGGDACGIGHVGTGLGQFGPNSGSDMAFGPTSALFVADVERIQRFNSEGEYEASVPVSGKTVNDLAVAPGSGDFYITGTEEDVRVLDSATGAEIGKLKGEGPDGPIATRGPIATDSASNVYVVGGVGIEYRVLEFDSAGKPLSPSSCCAPPTLSGFPFRIGGLATNVAGDLYVANALPSVDSFIRSFGPGPARFEAAPPVPPFISAQFASSVGRNDATLAAEINPHFWSDARYYVEYGTGKCSEGGCEEIKPVSPGALLTSKVIDTPLKSAGILLERLEPGTTYHYRFVAQSSGGGPVRGVGGEVGVDGGESSFATYPAPIPAKSDCPNQIFRTGFSAPLSDCRAFEMVSPVDKNNGDIKTLLDGPNYSTSLTQSAADGGKFTYSSYRAFADPKAAPYANQYLAVRSGPSGWSSRSLDPAKTSHLRGGSFDNPYKAFSADLCTAWLGESADPVLVPGVNDEYTELYRHDECGGGGYEALTRFQPPPSFSFSSYPFLQGTSADGKEAILVAQGKLTADATANRLQAYYASEGQLHLLCIGVDGLVSVNNCSAGTGTPDQKSLPADLERRSSLSHAISSDGSRVYWTDSGAIKSGAGKIYLRLNPGEEQSAISGGKCIEAEKACTVKVSETVTSKASLFLAGSADGSKALFEIVEGAQSGSLYEFDLETASSRLIAAKGLGVAGASEDLSHVYFVSEEALPETSGASAGKPNLYLDEEGTKTFIATLSKRDAGQGVLLSNTNFLPIYHVAKATGDGSHLVFISTEDLTGYDNTDQVTGDADSEIYLYEAGAPGPVCVSCNPSGARPRGQLVFGSGAFIGGLPAAGSLTTPENQLYSPRVLSSDGLRLFFNGFDALLPRDTNGKQDVYEWEAALGPKECEKKGSELYVASSDGCISLISSGQSPSGSEFLDASASGSDAFFTTSAGLLPQDPGLIDVYDAREGGGLPAPPPPPGPCQGEACQNAAPPPNDPTPASASFKGTGNLKPTSRCARGKVARKGRCVAKKHKPARKRHRTRAANDNRRTSR